MWVFGWGKMGKMAAERVERGRGKGVLRGGSKGQKGVKKWSEVEGKRGLRVGWKE